MDHRPKCNHQNLCLDNIGEKNNCHLGLGKDFLYGIQNWTSSKLKTLILQKTQFKKWQTKPQTGRSYSENISDKVPVSSIHKELL